MAGLDDLLKGAQGGGGGGLGGILGGILGGGSSGGSLAGGLGGNPMLRMLLPMVASMLANGGLKKVLSGLQAKGKAAETDSWVSTGENQPVAGEDIREAVGDDEITSIAEKLGVSKDEAATAVAAVLPDVVDQVSPTGELPPDDELESAFDRLRKVNG
ncbi:MAG: DUF937 domain-containing protein [Actinobacteria bacterium]|nr:DUF937 domain-containing protein [Actinomycetota bacterium]